MIPNSHIQEYEHKLKKYVRNSIYDQSLADCQLLMKRPQLNKFYQQLQHHLLQENLKKTHKQRKLSLENYPVTKLNTRPSSQVTFHPEYIPSRVLVKSRVSLAKLQRNPNNDDPVSFDEMLKKQIVGDMSDFYFVRMIKNPKTIRYIRSKPFKDQSNTQNALKQRSYLKPKLMETNYEERKIILQEFKKVKNLRNSTIV